MLWRVTLDIHFLLDLLLGEFDIIKDIYIQRLVEDIYILISKLIYITMYFVQCQDTTSCFNNEYVSC